MNKSHSSDLKKLNTFKISIQIQLLKKLNLHFILRPPGKMLSGEIVFIIRAISPKRLGGSVNTPPNPKGDAKGIHNLTLSETHRIS